MKKFIIILFLIAAVLPVCELRAEDTSSMQPADLMFWKVMKTYDAKDTVALDKLFWFNSPWLGNMRKMTNTDLTCFDSISYTIKPMTVVYYKRMGYDHIESRVVEEFKGFNIKNMTYQESKSASVFKIIKDEIGNYYIMDWKRSYSKPMINIEKKEIKN